MRRKLSLVTCKGTTEEQGPGTAHTLPSPRKEQGLADHVEWPAESPDPVCTKPG